MMQKNQQPKTEEGPENKTHGDHIHAVGHMNTALGIGQAVAGLLTGSATLRAASVHNLSDGYTYYCRGRAAEQKVAGSPKKAESLRKRAQGFMLSAGFGLLGYEYFWGNDHDGSREGVAESVIEYTAMSAEVGVAVASLHRLWRRREEDNINRNAWTHVLAVDTPAAIITAYGVIGASLGNEAHDQNGLLLHAALLAYAGVKGLAMNEELHKH